MQSSSIILGGWIAETNVHSTIFDAIIPAMKLFSIYRFNCEKLHLINVFRR